jgi:DNA-binding SARP family transcriptional activator
MRFSVLGPLEVRHDGAVVELTRPKERRLLALLISRAGCAVPMVDIVEELWRDEPPPSAARTVQSHIVRLRKAVPEIETSAAGYLLRAEPDSVDARVFEEFARRGAAALRAGDAGAAAATLAAALGLWRGPAYAEFTGDGAGFAAVEAARLAQLRVVCLEDRWDAGLRVGEHREAVADLELLLAEEPLRERLWGLLMLALYRCERQADALAAYQRARRVLGDELGVDPGPGQRPVPAGRRIHREYPVTSRRVHGLLPDSDTQQPFITQRRAQVDLLTRGHLPGERIRQTRHARGNARRAQGRAAGRRRARAAARRHKPEAQRQNDERGAAAPVLRFHGGLHP